ncbi:MAG: hypothetical protein AAGF98_17500, partial [Cyanobacteria bacterium P01_H01_bin.153]
MAASTPTQKSSNNLWLWITLGVCGGLLALVGLLVIGLVGGAAWFFFNEFNLSLNPEAAEELAPTMMDYELPGEEQGLVSSSDFLGAEVAVVEGLETDIAATLMLGKIPPAAQDEWGTRPEDFLQIFEEEDIFAVTEINVESTTTESRSLCGETATVRLSKGQEEFTGTPATVYEAVVIKDGFTYLVSLSAAGTNHSAVAS